MDTALQQASPLLVIGMHRSGTRFVADVLAELGVFMGADRQGDSESITFIRINEAIFHQCGTFWSEPMAAHVVLTQPEHAERIAELVGESLAAELPRYVGDSPWRAGATPEETPPFGWKDPRNTFTLPVWRRIFPSLRTIHVLRHGVDVAASLARRHRRTCLQATGGAVPSPLAVFQDHSLGVLSSRRGWTLAEAFTMWDEYVEKARMESVHLGERAVEIRFEELLSEPDRVISTIAGFCGVQRDRTDPQFLGRIASDRAFAFRRDPELAAFAETVGEILDRHGYAP
jgi:hypothetical protein